MILNSRDQVKSCWSHSAVSISTGDALVLTSKNIVNSKFTFAMAFSASQKLMSLFKHQINLTDEMVLGHLYRLSSRNYE